MGKLLSQGNADGKIQNITKYNNRIKEDLI